MLEKRTLTISIKEINRCEVIKMAVEKKITQREGARQIGITERHFRRLLGRYRTAGPESIISGHRVRGSNNWMEVEKEKNILGKLKEDYRGFGPILASEKLSERDGIKVCKVTVRQIMIRARLHQPKIRKIDKVHSLPCLNKQ